MALYGKTTTAELENYIAREAGVESVRLVEPDPIFIKSFVLDYAKTIGKVVVFRNPANEVSAVLVPFGV